jgi:hypothetical protein
VLTNALLFSGYLLLRDFGVGAKTAMSLLYVPGVIVGFLGNRNFTFRHEGRIPASMVRYFAPYAFGYCLPCSGAGCSPTKYAQPLGNEK